MWILTVYKLHKITCWKLEVIILYVNVRYNNVPNLLITQERSLLKEQTKIGECEVLINQPDAPWNKNQLLFAMSATFPYNLME